MEKTTEENSSDTPSQPKVPTQKELEEMRQKSLVNQFKNLFDQASGRAQGIERDAVNAIIMNSVKIIMQTQNENEKLRNENNQLKTEIANIQGSNLKKTVKVKTQK